MNLAHLIDDHPDDRPALLSRGRVVTYGELRLRVDELRSALVGEGVRPGDRVGVVIANNPNFVIVYFAVLGAGAVAVPLNPTSPAAELERQLDAVEASIVVVGPSGRDAMARVAGAVPSIDAVFATEGVELDGARPLGDLSGAPPAPVVERGGDDLAALLFTAGTSDSPKAAMLTHENLLANLGQMQQHPDHGVRPDDVVLGVLPMFHIFGLNVMLGLAMKAGASILLIERFDPASALDSIADRGVTVVAGAPPMYAAWASVEGRDPDAFQSVRIAASGAAALPPEVAARFEHRFGLAVHEGYGLTEAGPTVTSSVGLPPRSGSCGVPLPGVEVRLVDESGGDVLQGDAGEIWVRGPNVFSGYWGDAEATARVVTDDEWLRTGDVAVADADGYLYLVDRAKDIIIVSGFNVYPAEVEAAVRDHPAVVEVAVIGVPHPHTGEAVKAFVVTTNGGVEEDDLIEFCATRLARYKCPSKITFVDELPKGLGGKLRRRELQ